MVKHQVYLASWELTFHCGNFQGLEADAHAPPAHHFLCHHLIVSDHTGGRWGFKHFACMQLNDLLSIWEVLVAWNEDWAATGVNPIWCTEIQAGARSASSSLLLNKFESSFSSCTHLCSPSALSQVESPQTVGLTRPLRPSRQSARMPDPVCRAPMQCLRAPSFLYP